MAQRGTGFVGFWLCLLLAGCPTETLGPYAGSGGAAADGGKPDAHVAQDAECKVDTDCVVVMHGCCACPPLTRDELSAVHKSREEAERNAQCPGGPAECAACAYYTPDPLAPIFKAGCVANHCQLVDLRQAELSRCTSDADCSAIGQGCCPPSSDDPQEYVGVQNGADTSILLCNPALPCLPPQPHGDPLSFCASDGHCAVRRREKLTGTSSDACFSPTQNLEHAYDSAAQGCDCQSGATPLCRADSTGRNVALFCEKSQWESGEDGPCDPGQHP